jgi:uncharacterized protein (TIGR03437 family)
MEVMRIAGLGLIVFVCPLLAQGPNVVTQAGYTAPQPIRVAPGQVITLFVRTSSITLTNAVAANGLPLPTSLAGLSVSMRQTFSEGGMDVPILSANPVQLCSAVIPATCSSLTAITVQIPFELVANVVRSRMPANFATLTVFENGVPGDPLPLFAVGESIHILNSCDAPLAPNPGICHALITHANGTPVTAESPANPNELLTLSAYGLGRTAVAVKTGAAPPDAVEVSLVKLGFNFGTNASAADPDTAPLSAALAAGKVGLYEIKFRVPDLPQDAPLCEGSGDANLTVSLGRGASLDSVGMCVALPK